MVFNSVTFLIFLAVTLSLYYRLNHRGQNWLLLVASYIFYGWWDFRFAFLLLATSLLDYWFALWIDQSSDRGRRKLFLTLSIVLNMGVLCLFKYFNFFAESFEAVLRAFGMQPSFPILNVILPIGISFYTFLSMSYTIDVYRGEIPASRSPVDFLLYVCFFPHLVAGPIVRASYLLPQCQKPRVINPDEVTNGIWLILMGYVKKVVIADQLAQFVNWGFSGTSAPFPDANAWLVIYAFAFQIYGDFSGYSDIARGLSKLMGFELVENFRAPYLITNPSAFWRHWHISLSTWLRDYLYIPLGGNRFGEFKTYRNLMITMVLGGLWHGAGAAYLLWGFYHGLMLSVHRWWTQAVRKKTPGSDAEGFSWRRLLRIILFFHLTCIGWLLFRAGALPREISQVQVLKDYLVSMFNFSFHNGIHPTAQAVLLLGLLALFFQARHEMMNNFSKWPDRWKTLSIASSLAAIFSLGIFEGSQFIYFQF